MTTQRRVYSREFELRAVQLLETSGKSAAEIERELGIGDGCLLQWKKKLVAEGEGQCQDNPVKGKRREV